LLVGNGATSVASLVLDLLFGFAVTLNYTAQP
jgi:hypothetical protein